MIDQLQRERWFGGKSRTIRAARVVDRAGWAADAQLCLVEVEYELGSPETYVLAERLGEPTVARAVLDRFGGPSLPTEAGGWLVFTATDVFHEVPCESTQPISAMGAEQSNTSIRFGGALMLKLFRRLQFGPNPEVEVGYFLAEHTQFRDTPALVGSVDYLAPGGLRASLVLLQRFVPNRGDAWTTTLRRLEGILDGADVRESVEAMARLARTTADLHIALATGRGDFSAESIDELDIRAWRQAIVGEAQSAVDGLSERNIVLDGQSLLRRAEGIRALKGAQKTRHHGDYHLGQVLEREDGTFVVIDFEGEPSKPLAQRRERRSPLRDVAGMLRSLDYARNAALRAGDALDADRMRRAEAWHASVREAFLAAYLSAVAGAAPGLLPSDPFAALTALELEKAVYEVLYELNNRPDWLPIPLAALQASATLSPDG
ncbi:MAG: hypothetical protein ACR2IK_21250 [Chloroflexota bacterium]